MLIGNGRLIDKIPMSFLGSDWNAQMQPGALVASTQTENFGALAAMPDGYYQPQGWLLPRTAGRIAAKYLGAGLLLGAAGAGAMGINTGGTASITFALVGTGGLISSASGIAGLTLSAAGTIFASKNTSGTASILFGGTGALTAIGHTGGAASITFAAQWEPYAVGWLSGSSAEQGLTVAGITNAVWGALSTNYNTAGTMGNKLNSAASGGVDYTALGAAVWASVSRTLTAGAAPDATEIANAVLAALSATAIPVNIAKVAGTTVAGSGTAGDPWKPA